MTISIPGPSPQQQAVIDAHIDGPHLVNAGAGTGKTYTLVARTLELVQRDDLRSDELLLITFTNAAAAEIAARIDSAFGTAISGRPTYGTFHSVAAGLLREFSYATGMSPDVRVIDEGRARGVFAQAFAELRNGRLELDLDAFPLIERGDVLMNDLAGVALQLKTDGTSIDEFETRALAAADELERIPFGALTSYKKNKNELLANWPKPDPPRDPAERAAEAKRERQNVRTTAALFRRFYELLDAGALLTFGDVLVRATRMLHEHSAITQRLRARWRHAIVDEFQDTNPAQLAFLRALFGDALRPVLAVGDVRQAIYQFNGADPRGILDFSTLAGCAVHALTENRRSYQPILDLAHHVLLDRGAIPDAFRHRLDAHRDVGTERSVHFELFADDDAAETEAAKIAQTILKLGAKPSDCVILLRGRRRASIFAKALRARGIASQMQGGVGFFGSPDVREAIAWLMLAETPGDLSVVVATLQSAAVNLGDGVVTRLAAGRDLPRAALLDPLPEWLADDERARLVRYREIARVVSRLGETPLPDAVRAVAAAAGVEIARGDNDADFAQARANMDKLVALAIDFTRDRPDARIRDFLTEIELRDELELDLPPAELEGDRVAIMTIHASKGREWPYVFLADVSPQTFPSQGGGGNDVVVKYDRESGVLAFKHGIDMRLTLRWYLESKHDYDENGVVPNIGKAAKDPTKDDEEFRLLYVALTRARDAVFVSGRQRGNRISECALAVSAWLDEQEVDPALRGFGSYAAPSGTEPASAAAAVETDLKTTLVARRKRSDLIRTAMPTRPGRLSYSAMELHERCPRRARYHYVFGLPDFTDDDVPTPMTIEPAREYRHPARFGKIVHSVLENHMKARKAGLAFDFDATLADAVAQHAGSDVEARDAAPAARAAIEVLASFEPVAAEEEFSLTIAGTPLGGYIDLIARDADGRLTVVDYKTGKAPSEHYALQFGLYAHAVERQYGERPRTVLLRIGEHVEAVDVVPTDVDALETAVAAARDMNDDVPRPGIHCRTCPYAHDICEAAPIEQQQLAL